MRAHERFRTFMEILSREVVEEVEMFQAHYGEGKIRIFSQTKEQIWKVQEI